jgi:hypothetical protein
MKTTVMPGQHVLNGHIVDFSFFLKHLQDFVPEGLFKVFLMEVGRHLETAIVMETPIRDDAVKMGMKIEKIARCVNGNAGAGHCIVIR